MRPKRALSCGVYFRALARAVLSKAAQILRGDRDDVARGISLENGKTLAEANIEVEKSADFLDFYAATARMPQGGIIADGRPGTRAMILVEPIGIVAMITPWNDPMLTPARKLGPALISGNAVILKPAREDAPCGVPPGTCAGGGRTAGRSAEPADRRPRQL